MGRHIMNVVLIVTRKNLPTRIWNNIVVDVQSISMRIFLTISTVSVSLGILYPPWGTQFLLVAVLNLCLHLMDLKTVPKVQLQGKSPRRRVEPKTTSPPRDKLSPKDVTSPETEDTVKGLVNMGVKKSDAVRLVIQARSEGLKNTKDLLRRCITLIGQK